VSTRAKLTGGGVVAMLLVLALLGGMASPGFSIAAAPGAVGRAVASVLLPPRPARATTSGVPPGPTVQASAFALADIPSDYLALYIQAAHTCPALTWQLLAGIGKVETNHGRTTAPGVHHGINRYGCCAGPMQFNIRNGPPSTWDTYGDGTPTHVYQAQHAIPAAAHKLCTDGLANPTTTHDPCPTVRGTPAQHTATFAYNHACWYTHQVLTLASRYTTTTPPAPDPFTQALGHNPHLQPTTTRGCNPTPDLANPNLDLRIQSLLTVLAQHWTLRISCIHTGHSRYVAGTHRLSNHTLWRAVDIDQINHQPVSPQSATTRALITWLDHLQGPLRPQEIGAPVNPGHPPYFTDPGHQDHIHIGYGPL
jgi:hypothetical protein